MLCQNIFEDLNISHRVVVKNGRFVEEKNIEFYIGIENKFKRLLVMKVFSGRPPFYRKWVEVFAIQSEIDLEKSMFIFIDSVYEDKLINCLSNFLNNGESLFIEYTYDKETWKILELGIPPHLTRLGYKLLKHGFTWFKDWYFPEGFMEGGPKIQAEKPINSKTRARHIEELCSESNNIYSKLFSLKSVNVYSKIATNCINRYVEFINIFCKKQL